MRVQGHDALDRTAASKRTGVAVDCLTRDWRQALDWMTELVFEPAFPVDRCAWQRRQGGAELESLRDEPDSKAAWAFAEQLYSPHAAGVRFPAPRRRSRA